MYNKIEYKNKKMYCSDCTITKNPELKLTHGIELEGEEYNVSKTFTMTAQYRRFLKQKQKKEFENRIEVLKEKLTFQMKKYGEVDKIDFEEFTYCVKTYNEIYK